MLQMQLASVFGKDLRLPSKIRYLHINPRRHLEAANDLSDGRKGCICHFLAILHMNLFCLDLLTVCVTSCFKQLDYRPF